MTPPLLRRLTLATLASLSIALSACDSMSPVESGVTGVEITTADSAVELMGTLQLQAVVQPTSAPQGVTWTSGDESVATVSASGLVTGVAPGPAVITATSTADPTKNATRVITVSDCPAPREVSGAITSDQTWENWVAPPACVDYIARAGLTNQGGLLTIEPGVRVAFESGRSLVIRGDAAGLRAVGTVAEPIVLTGLESTRGFWGAVWIDGSRNSDNRIEHVTIEYGGGGSFSGSLTRGNLLLTGGAETTLHNTTLRHGGSYGLSMASGAALLAHGQNSFTQNVAGPAHVSASQAHFLDATSTASGNDTDFVAVAADDIEAAVTWVPMGDGYLIEQESDRYAFDVRGAGAFLTLEPGVRIVFQEDMAMTVADGARIAALGTAAAPVVLTGEQTTRGFWRGFRTFSDNDNNRFDHVRVEYGGGAAHSGEVEPGNVFVAEDATIRITNSVLREGGGYGLVARGGASLLDFNGNVLTGNVLGAAHVFAEVAADLTDVSTYTGNGRDVIDVYAYTSRITTPTVWEDLGVPYVITDTPVGVNVDAARFTVGAGVEILFQGGTGLSVNEGVLDLQGTESAPIRLAGAGEAWKGIQVFRSQASFAYTTLVDAGSSSWGSVDPAAAVTVNTAGGDQSSASFGVGTSQSGAEFGLRFGPGATLGAECTRLAPISVPVGDTIDQHCP